MSYQDCVDAGREGEQYAVSVLEEELQGTGLTVHWSRYDDYNSPFDIEVLDGQQVLVCIENKDITGAPQGVWQKKNALRRKRKYAQVTGAKKILTTVTDRDRQLIGFDEGLVSQRVTDFDFRKKALIKEILSTRGGMTSRKLRRFWGRLKDSLFLWLLFAPIVFGFLLLAGFLESMSERRKKGKVSA